jgi:hypothetical protein
MVCSVGEAIRVASTMGVVFRAENDGNVGGGQLR